jgi:hypothetical protein
MLALAYCVLCHINASKNEDDFMINRQFVVRNEYDQIVS